MIKISKQDFLKYCELSFPNAKVREEIYLGDICFIDGKVCGVVKIEDDYVTLGNNEDDYVVISEQEQVNQKVKEAELYFGSFGRKIEELGNDLEVRIKVLDL